MTKPPAPGAEDDLIPLAALQHYVSCPRRCALIHVERFASTDGAAVADLLLHARADREGADQPGPRVARGLSLRSLVLGIAGRAEAVELPAEGPGQPPVPFPLAYRCDAPKPHRADEVLLCAQAICLEEMFGVAVPAGAVVHGETLHRRVVLFDGALRRLTAAAAAGARADIRAGRTPPPSFGPGCRNCALEGLCRPARLQRPPKIARWLAAQLTD